ncbi:hypothetical protein [Candidatus Harpocratesius sp.]
MGRTSKKSKQIALLSGLCSVLMLSWVIGIIIVNFGTSYTLPVLNLHLLTLVSGFTSVLVIPIIALAMKKLMRGK